MSGIGRTTRNDLWEKKHGGNGPNCIWRSRATLPYLSHEAAEQVQEHA
jgi:hypothetical protein